MGTARYAATWPVLAMLAALVGGNVRAAAADAGNALVIGDGTQVGGRRDDACVQAARTIGERLARQGLAVTTLLEPTAVALRTRLDTFAASLTGSAAGTTLIYVCSDAIIEGTRIFVLPHDAAASAQVEPATEGVVLQALLNAIDGTGGTLYADLALLPGPRIGLAGQRVPAGLHLAVATAGSGASNPARLGKGLADPSVPITGWSATVAALSLRPGLGDRASSAFVPVPAMPVASPPPTPAAIPAPSVAPAAPDRPVAAAPPNPDASTLAGARAPASGPVKTTAVRPPRSAAVQANRTAKPGHAHRRGDNREVARVPNPRLARIQAALARRGLYAGPTDGELNAATSTAIRQFQASLGAPATGALTQLEIVRLLNP